MGDIFEFDLFLEIKGDTFVDEEGGGGAVEEDEFVVAVAFEVEEEEGGQRGDGRGVFETLDEDVFVGLAHRVWSGIIIMSGGGGGLGYVIDNNLLWIL